MKKLNNKHQSGRTLLETLAVLVIFGFLLASGGAIINGAMFSYNLNNTANQITTIYKEVLASFANEPDYTELGSDASTAAATAIKRDIIPSGMTTGEASGVPSFIHGFGGKFEILNSSLGTEFFAMKLHDLEYEPCAELLITIPNEILQTVKVSSTTIPIPIEIDKVYDACSSEDLNSITIDFKTNYLYN